MKNEVELKYDENGHDVIFAFRNLSEKEVLSNAQKARKSIKIWAKKGSFDTDDYDLQKVRFFLFMDSMVKFEGLRNVDLVRLLNPDMKGKPDGWDFIKPEAGKTKKLLIDIEVPFTPENKEMLCRSVGEKLAIIQQNATERLTVSKEDELMEELKNFKG